MDDSVAYADNWSDRALLERVGQAVVVHPHRQLKRLAKVRGWIIVRPASAARRSTPATGMSPIGATIATRAISPCRAS